MLPQLHQTFDQFLVQLFSTCLDVDNRTYNLTHHSYPRPQYRFCLVNQLKMGSEDNNDYNDIVCLKMLGWSLDRRGSDS